MVTSRLLKHVGDQFGGNRRSTLILFVLTRIREEGDNGGDSFRARDLAGVNHDAKLHEGRVDLATAGVYDINVILTDRLCDANVRLSNPGFRDRGSGNGYAETAGVDENRVRNGRLSGYKYRLAMTSASSG